MQAVKQSLVVEPDTSERKFILQKKLLIQINHFSLIFVHFTGGSPVRKSR